MSLNFSFAELCKSDTAIKNGIRNIPDTIATLDNMLNLIHYCLQPIRNRLGKPMNITSCYRNSTVNKLVGGVPNSQHNNGQAADFTVTGMTVAQVCDFIRNGNFEYDQLINEYDKWVHISFNKNKNRKQYFKLK